MMGATTNRLVFGIFAALAEFERALIVERTKAGLEAARARGRNDGAPFKRTSAKLRLAQATMGKPERRWPTCVPSSASRDKPSIDSSGQKGSCAETESDCFSLAATNARISRNHLNFSETFARVEAAKLHNRHYALHKFLKLKFFVRNANLWIHDRCHSPSLEGAALRERLC